MRDDINSETVRDDDDMPSEIDFSKAEVGKFYRPNAVFHIPLYLDRKVQDWVVLRATSKGVSVEDIANELLRREIEIIEAMTAWIAMEAKPGSSSRTQGPERNSELDARSSL